MRTVVNSLLPALLGGTVVNSLLPALLGEGVRVNVGNVH